MTSPPRVLATRNGWLTLAGALGLLALYAAAPGPRWYVVNVYHVMRDIYEHRNASLTARAETVHGHAWRMMQLVREKTPTTARIVIPTGLEHGTLGSTLWCAYYLYPRHLLQEKDLAQGLAGHADYILVDKGWGLALAGAPADSVRGDESGLLEVR